jgi:hypothetical protein
MALRAVRAELPARKPLVAAHRLSGAKAAAFGSGQSMDGGGAICAASRTGVSGSAQGSVWPFGSLQPFAKSLVGRRIGHRLAGDQPTVNRETPTVA